MIYIMSDLHGCYQTFLEALHQIHFSDDDTLYILGDVIDRGSESIPLLQDMSMRWNVIPLLGNHEYMALQVLERFCVEIKEDNYDSHLTSDDLKAYLHWMENGGDTTLNAFLQLDKEERFAIIDYLNEFTLYETLRYQNQNYLLVHAGLCPYDPQKSFDDYQPYELLFQSQEVYDLPYTMICGHTPTFAYGKEYENKIFQKDNYINIDCGLVYGRKLAVYCLDSNQVIYIDKKEAL